MKCIIHAVSLSNIKSDVLHFNVLRDYFVIKQIQKKKTKTPLCCTILGRTKIIYVHPIAYIHLDLGSNTITNLTKSIYKS